MSETEYTKELRLFGGSHTLEYIKRFSSTEKAIFGILVLAALVTALAMAFRASNLFMVEIPARGGELREGVVGLPRTVNPVLAITDVDRDLSSLAYSGLMKYSDGSIVPDLARSYSVSDDGLTYDFKLRPDARFSDGKPLTADDVEFTLDKIQDPNVKSPRRADWANVTVKKISPAEIQFVLKQAYSPFLTNTTVGILPKHIWGNVSDDQFIFSQYNIEPIGSGPYRFSGMKRDGSGIPTEYTLKTWSGYYGKEPYVTTLAFDFYADEDKALEALDSGSIDSLAAVPSSKAARLASNSGQAYTVLTSPLPRIFGIFLNQNQNALLADKPVRQALSMAIDRQALVKVVFSGYGTPIDGPLPPGLAAGSGADPNAASVTLAGILDTGTSTPSNIAEARALLEKNGWKRDADGIYMKKSAKSATTTLSFDLDTANSEDLKQAADMIKSAWSRLGVNVNIRVFEQSDLYQNVIRPRKFDALLFGEQIGKDRDLYAFWHSSQRNAPGLNVTMYTNSKADKILEDIRSTNDDKARAADYASLDELIRSEIPAIFLYSPDFTYVVPKSLKGIALNTVTVPSDRWNSVGDWYLNTEKVWKIFAN